MKKITFLITICTLGAFSTACLRFESGAIRYKANKNKVILHSQIVNQHIGDESVKFQVISKMTLAQKSFSQTMLSPKNPLVRKILAALPQGDSPAESTTEGVRDAPRAAVEENSLVLGLPIGLIGEQNVFGGVITHVSDSKSDALGGLKLTDLDPIHVRTLLTAQGDGAYSVTLFGCANDCAENSPEIPLISFNVLAYNAETKSVMIDLASLGEELNLVAMLDPKGEYTNLKSISSVTTSFDYSYSTLVFDIKTKMIAKDADLTAENPVTEFTVRWYLKLNSFFNPSFIPRSPVKGVGFFQTKRSTETKITRFANSNSGRKVHYFIKNVPEKYRKTFAGALDNWNKEITKIIGKDLLSYEFVEADDLRDLVTGDIRYNIIEWDLKNKAPYGGLGPSIANQHTGETISANVLIQGPTIMEMYTKWFNISKEASELKEKGLIKEANQLLKEFNQSVTSKIQERKKVKFSLKLGKHLQMNIHSQRPELEDPITKGHFEIIPEGVSFDEYMTGYFTEMLEHELGHNLGLRHNFKGNLGAFEAGTPGSVSRSIMEYLGRPYRHLNAIGQYDKMAISYGYTGLAPKHTNWFCSDEDEATDAKELLVKSPECTKVDATSDPYSFFEARFDRIIDLLVGMKTASAPVWEVNDLEDQVKETVQGLSAYALSAEATADSWTNFFSKGDRPENKLEVKAYVLERFKAKLCNPRISVVAAHKESVEGTALVLKNIAELKKSVEEKTKAFNLTDQIKCD